MGETTRRWNAMHAADGENCNAHVYSLTDLPVPSHTIHLFRARLRMHFSSFVFPLFLGIFPFPC